MERRRILRCLGGGITGLAGCAWRPGGSASDGEDSPDGCRTPDDARQPSGEDLAFGHSFTGTVDRPDRLAVTEEVFDLANVGDSWVDLSGHAVAFEGRDSFEIGALELRPTAELKILTHGDGEVVTDREDCLHFRHVRDHPLETPVFDDYRARVALVAPDGTQLLVDEFELTG